MTTDIRNSSIDWVNVSLVSTIVLALVLFIGAVIADVSSAIQVDYTMKMSVDKPEKICIAITNATECMRSKGFEVIGISVNKHVFSKKFTITCKGTDQATILNLDN